MSRTRALLMGVLFASLLVTGTAFAYTFTTTLAWQQRDAVTVEQTGVSFANGEFTVTFRVSNPLDRAVTVDEAELVVYGGEGRELSVRREAIVDGDEVRVGSGETATVLVRAPAVDDDRAARATENGSATPSGLLHLRISDREFLVEVGPDG